MTDSAFSGNFRSTEDYLKVIQDFLVRTILPNNLKASDLVVIATIIGIMGTEPIRKNVKLSETAESIIVEGMDRGKAAFRILAKRMAIIGPSRRFPKQSGITIN